MTKQEFTRVDDNFMKDLADLPGVLDGHEKRVAARDEEDRIYAANLSAIRRAGQLTQQEVARRLGISQGSISKTESRDDMLLSTLLDYLNATGADEATISVKVRGQRIELDLASLTRIADKL